MRGLPRWIVTRAGAVKSESKLRSCALSLILLLSVRLSAITIDSQTVRYSDSLELTIYYPVAGVNPAMLHIHGGGFVRGDRHDYDNQARLMALRGWVGVTIDYRLCGDCAYPQAEGLLRALEGAQAAITWMLDHSMYYGIDTSRIYVCGASAGAGTAMALAYFSPDEWSMFPVQYPLGWGYSIKGIVNEWGMLPPAMVDAQEMVPMISFHGLLDTVAPIDSATYNGITAYGSRQLAAVLQAEGVRSELWIDPLGYHGVFSDSFRVEKIIDFFAEKIVIAVKEVQPQEERTHGRCYNLLGQRLFHNVGVGIVVQQR